MPDFVKIGQSVVKILRFFFDFSRWRPPPCWIFEIVNFYLLLVSAGPRRISVANFVKIGHSVAEILHFFRIFKMAAAAILDFWNREILLVTGVQRVETHHHAEFYQNRSISCEDIKIFQFFKMAAVPHLGTIWGIFGPPTVSTWGLYHSAKFGYDRCSSFHNMNISIFGTFGWKISIHAPQNWGFWAIWSPKWAAISTEAKKGTPLRDSALFEPLSVKMLWAVWPVGALLKKGYK